MRRLLRQLEIVDDDWRYWDEERSGEPQSIVVALAQLRANADAWLAWPGRLGVRIGPMVRLEEIADDLHRLSLVAIEFPAPSEGRGYTQARLLRARHGFKGEIRAVGAVKRDQVFFMSRCGFDSFELSEGEDFEAARAALNSYSIAYQPRGPLALR